MGRSWKAIVAPLNYSVLFLWDRQQLTMLAVHVNHITVLAFNIGFMYLLLLLSLQVF